MNAQAQYRASFVLGSMLGLVGLVTIGMGLAFGLSIQTLLDAGCQANALGQTACEDSISTLEARTVSCTLIGVASLCIGGGILYYLRNHQP